MWDICVSESRRTAGLSAMFGARSLPLPSRPWHWAQVEAKIFLPCPKELDADAFELFCGGFFAAVCEAAVPIAIHKTAIAAASMRSELRFESI
jgi:hypothetical protein